jgi:hypothetical protein
MNVRPHVAQNESGRRSAIDKRTTRHPGYGDSLRVRKSIEDAFGWIKTVAGLQNQAARPRQGRLDLHLRGRRRRSRAGPEADRAVG